MKGRYHHSTSSLYHKYLEIKTGQKCYLGSREDYKVKDEDKENDNWAEEDEDAEEVGEKGRGGLMKRGNIKVVGRERWRRVDEEENETGGREGREGEGREGE